MRILAGGIALIALIALGAQWVVSSGLMAGEGPGWVIWRMLGYFTVLSNIATLVLMARVAITGKISAKTAALITVVMMVVGLGYHALLASQWSHTGLAWWADQGLHTAVPVAMILWWVRFAPKAGLAGRDALRWTVWPLGYAIYAVLRGLSTGFYPYPFMDVSTLGLSKALMNIGALGACFAALALCMIGVARIIR